MNTISMKSKNSPTTDSLRLLFNSSGKTNLKSCNKYLAPSNLSIYYTRKNKKVIKTINLKYQLQRKWKNLNYLIDHTLYQTY